VVKLKRKVIQIADSTQLISLPRKWAQKHEVKKGDELDIKEEGSKIIVSTEQGQSLGRVEVDISNLDRDSLMFLIRCLYIKGYDEMKLRFDDVTTKHHKIGKDVTVISSIKEEVNRLNGIEIIQQKENSCFIKDISEGVIKELDTILRRIFLLLIDASKDLVKGSKENNHMLLDTINEKHDTITKFAAYNLRLLNKFGYTDDKKTNTLYHIISSLDEIIDIIKYCSRFVTAHKIKLAKDAISIISDVQETLSLYHDFFYNFDLKKAEKLSKDRSIIFDKVGSLVKKVPANNLFILSNMEQILEVLIHLTVSRIGLEY